MKFVFPLVLLTLAACTPKDPTVGGGPVTDEITRGGRYNLRIGSPPATVYARLQALGLEKTFDRINVAARTPYGHPTDLPVPLGNYDVLTLETTTGRTDRVVLQFTDQIVDVIERGGGRLDSIPQWPAALPASQAVVLGDSLTTLVPKLTELYREEPYASYALILPDKPLDRPYDPAMGSYNVWNFTFSEDRDAGVTERHNVSLRFAAGELDVIRVTRERFERVH
ncbi:hypothetical protein [Lewinella sp. IMCC34183]|uniref:hypothetical protein n=1 Tax=Lewinella sp. IMCC34183 TaxID=2248762 RepID=UPI000E289A21|nr:hypothetical protein [Lewinella sp. IMCC34183]